MKKEAKIKGAIYGGNILVNPLIKSVQLESELGNPGNPVGAAIYFGVDLISYFFPKLSSNKYIGVAKVLGAGYYAASSFLDAINGKFEDLIFEAPMAYQLITDSAKIYRNKSLKKDFREIGKSGKDVYSKTKPKVEKLGKTIEGKLE
ncbi:MAG: hypothetical protein Q8Q04_03015 [archaeon]|nr:hypothetical protein [archaeon]